VSFRLAGSTAWCPGRESAGVWWGPVNLRSSGVPVQETPRTRGGTSEARGLIAGRHGLFGTRNRAEEYTDPSSYRPYTCRHPGGAFCRRHGTKHPTNGCCRPRRLLRCLSRLEPRPRSGANHFVDSLCPKDCSQELEGEYIALPRCQGWDRSVPG